jgi:hypothetical protein
MLFVAAAAAVVDAGARFALSSAAFLAPSSLRSTTPAKPPPTSIWRAGQGRLLGGMAPSRNSMRGESRSRGRERE